MSLRRLSLIGRITLTVLLVEVAAFSAFGWFFIAHISSRADARLQDRIQFVGQLLSDEELPLSTIARQPFMSALLGERYLQGAVIGGNGRIIASTEVRALGRAAADVAFIEPDWLADDAPDQQYLIEKESVVSVQRVRPSADVPPLYTVLFRVSTGELAEEKRRVLVIGLTLTLFAIAISSLLISWRAHGTVTRRVETTLDALKQVERGAFAARVPVGLDDELGALQRGINSMAAKVGELVDDLRRNEANLLASQAALKESEQRFRLAVEGANDGIWDWDWSQDSLYLSPRWKEMLGYRDEELENRLQTFLSLLHEDDQARVFAVIEHYRGRQQSHHAMELRMRHKQGHWVWVLDRGKALRDDAGEICRIAGSHTDISDLKNQREAFEKLSLRLSNILEGTNAGTWEWNVQTGEAHFNDRWAELLGYRLEDLQPVSIDTWLNLAHPEDLPQSSELLTRHFRGELDYYECEARMRHRRGHWVWVLDRGKVSSWLAPGKPLWMSGTHQDISDRKQLEQDLAETSRERGVILENSNVGITFVRERRQIWCNQRMGDIFGFSQEEMRNASTRVFFRNDQEFQQLGETAYPILASGAAYTAEQVMRHRDGHELWVRLSGKAVDPEHGERGSIWVFEDISTQKELEFKLLEARHSAEAANIAKSRFLATMSHEIRTPMNGILGMAQILLDETLDERERRDYTRTILQSGKALLSLLNDILDLSKVESGNLELESAVIEPEMLVRQVRKLFQESARNKGLRLLCDWIGSPRSYRGDPHRIAQMLNNLVNNAIKFTDRGQVRVQAQELSRDQDGALLEFSVRDTGIGIAEDKTHLIFQPFSQVDSSISRKFGGSGLGLSIVSRLAELMGGEAGFSSEAGKGSLFWFRIPAEPVAEVLAGQTDSASVDDGDGAPTSEPQTLTGTLLVAEDDRTNRAVIRVMLTRLGLDALLVEDGSKALEQITSGKAFDLLLMDVQMPVLDGREATRRIRQWEQDQARRPIPIIALTADAFEEDRQLCLQAGMNDVLTKPVDLRDLRAALGHWLRQPASAATPDPAPAPVR